MVPPEEVQDERHRENQGRFARIEEEQVRSREGIQKIREIIIRIDENTRDRVPNLTDRVDELEARADRQKGAMWALTAIWTALEALMHFGKK